MKKLITLLLLFTITLFYSIPTQAYTINDLDVDIPELNNNTLREVFIDNNLLINNTFDNGLNNWLFLNATGSVINGQVNFTVSTNNGSLRSSTVQFINNTFIYYRADVKTNSSSVRLSVAGVGLVSHSGSGNFESISNYFNWTFGTQMNQIILFDQRTSGFNNIIADNFYLINLTSLGITSNRQSIDYYYNEFKQISAYIKGYNDGFDDGEVSNTSYALGYALGLSEGEDMETGSSLLILIVALIGFVMMIFGFTTKRGIFNLLSVGAFVVLGTLLVQFVGFVIIAIGLVLINIYYAFFGDL
jgi:hypothetical protein